MAILIHATLQVGAIYPNRPGGSVNRPYLTRNSFAVSR